MAIRLIQLRSVDGTRQVAVIFGHDQPRLLQGVTSTYELAQQALKQGVSFPQAISAAGKGAVVDYEAALRERRVLSPVDHPADVAHCLVTGTGLTHLGSAEGRDKMHAKVKGSTDLTDSMKMFKMGIESGKPREWQAGVQPEWFYKGNGSSVVAPEGPFEMPPFALDGGEEPEICGVYVIGPDGTPNRMGFAVGNEFSDHVMEKQNYLYLAHSKLRQCSIGPELLVGSLPHDVQGKVRIIRDGKQIWEKPFLSGEANMSHTLSNLEHHHFKYEIFRQAGDVHLHFFGTGTLSFSDGIQPKLGDVFEVDVGAFGKPLRNSLTMSKDQTAATITKVHDFNVAGGVVRDFNVEPTVEAGKTLIGWGFGQGKVFESTDEDCDRACELAGAAKAAFAAVPASSRAAFLDAIACEIEELGDSLLEVCSNETNLPLARMKGERERTTGQLRLFSTLLREGSWVQARLDVDSTKDLRRMMIPLGPVGVFAASNFPLAFSSAGGDTASALAAGCPVVMKAHSAHPRTSDLVGQAIIRAARAQGMPEGVYSMVYGRVGLSLVKHAAIKAIGFTGSYKGGRMFADAAAARPEPIPVFAEMGSINPVFLLPQAIQGDAAVNVATALAGSITQGAGQFCTNPGSIFVVNSPDAQVFLKALAEKIAATPTQPMLTPAIRDGYRAAVDSLIALGARALASGAGDDPARPMLLSAPASALLKNSDLAEECFGPSSCVFLAESPKEMLDIVGSIGGQLTGTIYATDGDLANLPDLAPALAGKVGRVVFNSVPTGVAVCESMQHGGPFPASSDARFTSVGTGAIDRFIRPVCYQGMPSALHPPELRDDNPLGIMRTLNNVKTRDSIEGDNSKRRRTS